MSEEKDYQELAGVMASLGSDGSGEDAYYDPDDYVSPADAYYYGDEVYYGEDPYASGNYTAYDAGGADPYDEGYDDEEDDLPAAEDTGMDGENVVLCVSNGYTKQYYFNRQFSNIPKNVQDELKIMCVWFTEECGGILTLEYDDDGNLLIKQSTSEYDGYYDQIGSELVINRIRRERKEFLMALELYYKVIAMGMTAEEIEASHKYDDE